VTNPLRLAESYLQNKVRSAIEGDTLGLAHHFIVSIDNSSYNFGSWSRATGLSVTWDVCEYRTGDAGNAVQVFPGATKYQRIKLSRAACFDSAVVQQWLTSTSLNCTPLSGAIYMVSQAIPSPIAALPTPGLPIVTWLLREFFPVGWSITDFEASASGTVAIETLELVHTGFLDDQSQTKS
jgi:phage tail-like protein